MQSHAGHQDMLSLARLWTDERKRATGFVTLRFQACNIIHLNDNVCNCKLIYNACLALM